MLNLVPGMVQVRESHVAILERFGEFDKVLKAGLHFINPFTEGVKSLQDWCGVASKGGYLMELTEQQYETRFCECNTKDKVTIRATASIYFKIVDPYRAAYVVDILPRSIETVCLNALKTKIGYEKFDDLSSRRIAISQGITSDLNTKTQEWGVKLLGVEVCQLKYDEKIHSALQKKRVEEAERDAESIRAEKKDIIAKSDAQTALIAAKAVADAYKIVQKSENETLKDLVKIVGSKDAIQLTSATKATNAMKALSESKGSVIALPVELKGLFNVLGLPNAVGQ